MPNDFQNSNFRFQNSAVILLVFLHLVAVLPLGYFLNIWADEGSTLYTTGFGVAHALQHALNDEKQAPLYFWFLSLWREINHSIFFARFFSIVCSCLSIKLFSDLARRIFAGNAAILAAAFFALHPYLIWASLEIRVYALVILLSVGLLRLFDALYFQTEFSAEPQSSPGANNRRNAQSKKLIFSASSHLRASFTTLSIVALYTNYYLGFLLVGCFAALVILRKRREAVDYLLRMFVAGIAFLPLIWTVKKQLAMNTSSFQAEKSIGEILRILWNLLLTFVLPTEIFTPETTTGISIFRVWFVRSAVLAILFLIVKNRLKPAEKTIVFGTISAVVTAFLFAAYYLIGGDYVGVRHAAVLFVPLILFVLLILREVLTNAAPPARKVTAAGLTILYSIFFIYAIYAIYPNLTKRGDWARIAVFLEREEKPNQPIIIFTTFDALCLPNYYHGANRILPDEKFFDFELEAAAGSADSWKKQTDFIVSEIPPDAPEIWLVNNEKCRVKDACLPLENFVRSNYTVIEEKQFDSETVRLLRKIKK